MRHSLVVWGIAFIIGLGGSVLADHVAVRFLDVAESAGLTHPNLYGGRDRKDFILETTGNGVAIFDYDGDGRNDLLFVNGTQFTRSPQDAPRTVQLYHNEGEMRFVDVSRKAGFTEEGWGQGACVGDYDNDGRPDVLITYYGHNRLYRNLGSRFEDVTAQAKLPVSGTRYGSGCAFLDYDRDGRLDLFIANYVDLDLAKTPKPGQAESCQWKGLAVMCGPQGLPLARNVLYHQNPDGTFTDVSGQAGILAPGGRYGLGVAAADFDNDGWPDLYVACDMTPSLLFQNKHDGTFEERGVAAGVAYNFDGQLQAGMGVAVADYDGDGRLDIAKTNFSGDLTSLFRNEDGKFFSDVSREAGLGARQFLGWGIVFTDVDGDGWKDLVMANGHVYPEVDRGQVGDKYRQPALLYRNLGNGKFADFTAQAGPAFQQARPARGLSVGDLNADGRPELVLVNMNEKPSLLQGAGPYGGWLTVQLVGTKSNRSAIGARVIVEAGGRKRIDEVMSGGSFYSQSELAPHFGLGTAKVVDRLTVHWPSGLVQEWKQIPVNQRISLVEGTDGWHTR